MRKSILSLGRWSNWSREELRRMASVEFLNYLEALNSLREEADGKDCGDNFRA